MSKNEVDEACQSFQDAMISFAKTKEGRKQLHNYILHMKDKTIGKRTGKPVRFTTDLDNLFISSPASSEIDVSDTDESAHLDDKSAHLDDESAHLDPLYDPDPVASTSLTPHAFDHEHTGTERCEGGGGTLNLSSHNINRGHRTPTQLNFSEREKHLSCMSEHHSQDATPQSVRLDATLIEPMTKYQLQTDGTKDGSFSMEPISSQHEYDGGLKTAKINKRLTFSEQLKRLQTPNPTLAKKQTLTKQPVKKKDTQNVFSALPISQIDEDSSYASDDSFEDQFVVEPVSRNSRLSVSSAESKQNNSKLNKTAKHKETKNLVHAKQTEVVTDVIKKPKVSKISKLRTPKKHTRVVQPKQLETSAANTTKHGGTELTAPEDISADVSKKSQPARDKPHPVRNTARKTINNSRQFQTDMPVKPKKTYQVSRHEIDDADPSHNLSPHSLQSETQKATVSNAVEISHSMSYSLRSNRQRTEATDIGGMESYSARTIPTKEFASLTEPLTSSKNKRSENRVEKSSSKQKNKRKKFLNISEQEILDDDVSPTKRRRTVQRKKSQPELLNGASNNTHVKEWLNSNFTDDPPSIVLSPHKPTKTPTQTNSKTGKSSKSTQRSSRRLEKPDSKTAPVLNKPHTSALAQSDVTEDITETLHHAVFPAVDQSTIVHPHEVSTRKNVLGPPASTPRRAYGRHKSKKVEEVVEPSALLIDIIADDSLPSINQSPDSYSEQFPSNIDIIGNTTAASSNGKVNDSNLSKKKSKPQKSKKAKSKDSNKTKEKQKPKRKPAQSTHDKVDYDTDKTITPPRTTKGKKGKNKIEKSSNVHDDSDKTITPPKRRYQRKRIKDDISTSKTSSMKVAASRKPRSKLKKLQDTCIFVPRPVEIIKPEAADNDGLRRSKRVRTRPLDPWEKLVYGDNGEPVGVQVDEWTTDVWFVKPKRKQSKPTAKTRKLVSKMADGGDEQTLDPSAQTLNPETTNDITSASQEVGKLDKNKKKAQRGGNNQEPEKSVDMTTSYQQKKNRNKQKKPVHHGKAVLESTDEASGMESQQELVPDHPHPSPTPLPTPTIQGERKRRGNRRKNDKKTENQSENLPEIADFHGVTSITVEQDVDHPPPSPTLDITPTSLPTPTTQGKRKRRGNRRTTDKKTDKTNSSTRDMNTTYTDISSQAATSALNINNSTLSIVLKKQVLTVGTKDFFHVPENTLHFGKTGEPWSPGEPIKHSKGISNSKFTMGMLEIAPGGQKELSCMKSNTLCCLVMSGTVCVEFGNRDTIVSCGAYFYVPPSNHYMITNVDSSQTAQLHFNILKHCNPMNTSNYDM